MSKSDKEMLTALLKAIKELLEEEKSGLVLDVIARYLKHLTA